MMQRSLRGTLAGFVVFGGLFLGPPPNLTGYPNSMASLGDSITRAFNTGGFPFTDAPGNSWSTGTRTSVQSHYVRILAAEPAILERNFNDAKSGAKMVHLDAQVSTATKQNVAYITILIGANDLCTRTVAGMTSIDDFRSRFEQAMGTLSAGSPRARIYVVSIPNVYRLWAVLKDDLLARLAWRTFDVCQSLLEDPRSTDPADVARRRSVRQRNIAFNTELAEVCAMYIHCRFDEGVVFEDPFSPEDVSRRDYFHPSLAGQRGLAQVTWAATFDFTDQIPPTSTATTAPVEGGTWVILAAADDVAVAGIEYRLDLGSWQRYADPFVLAAGSNIRFRAVDVNGNIEATHELTA
jgi:lysophospholipase L1-like esterase